MTNGAGWSTSHEIDKAVRMAGLTDKVAVITGATSGVGAAAVKRFAEEGAQVLAGGRDYLHPDEVVEMMLFLVGEKSRSCTGAMYMMDQGVTLL
jgi:enoyl-[acyl-carrier-protein] reductase (NADH)